MSVCVLYYDGFCEFEVIIACSVFRQRRVSAIALENRVYLSEEGQKFLPDAVVRDVNLSEVDLLVIPGGDPSPLYENSELRKFILALHEKNTYIAGICAGSFLMAAYGILAGRKCTGSSSGLLPGKKYSILFEGSIVTERQIVRDGNTITAQGQAFVEFGVELGKLLGVYEDAAGAEEDLRWYKNLR